MRTEYIMEKRFEQVINGNKIIIMYCGKTQKELVQEMGKKNQLYICVIGDACCYLHPFGGHQSNPPIHGLPFVPGLAVPR